MYVPPFEYSLSRQGGRTGMTAPGHLPLRVMMYVTSVLAAGRALYSLWHLAIAMLARGGEQAPLGTTTIIAETLSGLSVLQYGIWSSYTIGYAAIPVLLLTRSKLVLPVAIFAVATDLGYWIWSGMQAAYASLVSTGPVWSDAFINIADLAILFGVVVIYRSWTSHPAAGKEGR